MAPTYNEAVTQLYHSSHFSSVNDAKTYLKREKQKTLMIVYQTSTYYQHKYLYYVVTRLLQLFSATYEQ
jgi:hypothetical protein